MFGFQLRRIGLAVAALALAVNVLSAPVAPASADELNDTTNPVTMSLMSLRTTEGDSAQSVANDSLFKPGIEVTYLRKISIAHPINQTAYRFAVRNSGNLNFSHGVGNGGMCHYTGGNGLYSTRAWNVTPEWVNTPTNAGQSLEFTFYCKNVYNGDTLHHAVANAQGFYGNAYNQSVTDTTPSN